MNGVILDFYVILLNTHISWCSRICVPVCIFVYVSELVDKTCFFVFRNVAIIRFDVLDILSPASAES